MTRGKKRILFCSLLLVCLSLLALYLYLNRREEADGWLGDELPERVMFQHSFSLTGTEQRYVLTTGDAEEIAKFVKLINSFAFGKNKGGRLWKGAGKPEGGNPGGVLLCLFKYGDGGFASITLNAYSVNCWILPKSEVTDGRDKAIPVYFAPKEKSGEMEARFWDEMDAFALQAAQSAKWEVSIEFAPQVPTENDAP